MKLAKIVFNCIIIIFLISGIYFKIADQVAKYAQTTCVSVYDMNGYQISALYFSVIDSSLSQMKFKIYPKASLRVNLHRITPIVSGREFFDIDFSLTGDTRNGEPFVMTEANKDNFVLVNTAANVFTNIHSSKFITYDSAVNKIDSVKCVLNGNNSIDISF